MNLRRANLMDVEAMMSLINHFADQGLMLPGPGTHSMNVSESS